MVMLISAPSARLISSRGSMTPFRYLALTVFNNAIHLQVSLSLDCHSSLMPSRKRISLTYHIKLLIPVVFPIPDSLGEALVIYRQTLFPSFTDNYTPSVHLGQAFSSISVYIKLLPGLTIGYLRQRVVSSCQSRGTLYCSLHNSL